MFNTTTRGSAADAAGTLPTTSRRAFGRHLGLSAAGLALAGCSASEPSEPPADSAPAASRQSNRSSRPPRMLRHRPPSRLTPPSRCLPMATRDSSPGLPCVATTAIRFEQPPAHSTPFAVVLGCIDSRVPIETVFDQGIGDIFAARVAGNIVNTELLGSMEFACQLAGSKLVVVLGHTSCGAVKGSISSARLGNLTQLVQKIEPAVEAIEGERDVDNADYVDAVAEENVRLVIAEIRRDSPVLATMEQESEIRIVGAMYDVSTGAVRFI